MDIPRHNYLFQMRDDKSSSKSLFYGISYDIIVTFSRIQGIRACLESPRVRTAPSAFSPDEAKTAGNTLCINEDFGKIWRKRCKQDVRGEILNRL